MSWSVACFCGRVFAGGPGARCRTCGRQVPDTRSRPPRVASEDWRFQ